MFKQYQFKKFIYQGLDELKFTEPTNIQKIVIPKIMKGENVIGKSQTGTGKTHAFLLPLLNDLGSGNDCEICIIVPTRELAGQTEEEIRKITKFSPEPIDVRTFVGGSNRDSEIEKLSKSQPQIVIGTIGKLKDLAFDNGFLKIHTAKTIVIDEADMLFEDTEIEEIDGVFGKFAPEVQVLVFSATFPKEVLGFLNKYFGKFEVIDLSPSEVSKSSITHIFIPTKNKNKNDLLLSLLTNFQPYLALIFANTKTKVNEIADFLAENKLRVGKLTGDLEARARKQVLKRIKDGEFQYVVASDIAARGIDILGVSHVINYELPNDVEFYIHRTGRTARADFTGTAISFYDFDDDAYMNQLEAKGLRCVYKTLKDNELVPTKIRNARSNRVRKDYRIESEIHASIPVSKKVKPGYRKKRNEMIKKQVRQAKRARIGEMYRKRATQDNLNQKTNLEEPNNR